MTFVHRSWRLLLAVGLLLVAASAALPALAKEAAVSIVDKTFEPASITVNAGDVVTWTVTKSIGEPHSVTSGKPGTDQGTEFDSGIGLKDNGQSFKFTFDTPGTYDYFCQVHPTVMTGQIVVAPGQSPPAESEGPASSPEASPAGTPAATEAPVAPEASEPIPPERKLIAAGILAAALVVLFGAAWVWRRMNPA
jgi:plastocyanin